MEKLIFISHWQWIIETLLFFLSIELNFLSQFPHILRLNDQIIWLTYSRSSGLGIHGKISQVMWTSKSSLCASMIRAILCKVCYSDLCSFSREMVYGFHQFLQGVPDARGTEKPWFISYWPLSLQIQEASPALGLKFCDFETVTVYACVSISEQWGHQSCWIVGRVK